MNLRPSIGNFPHHIKNTRNFVQQIHMIKLQPYEYISLYDISTLFTTVPIDPAITIMKGNLDLDQELHLRTSMLVEHIISLLEFCLKTTYFQFQGRFFEHLQGGSHGVSSHSHSNQPLHGGFEIKAINTADHPPRVWKRYVDDTFVITESPKKVKFLKHINKINLHIHFTTKDTKVEGCIPFLDTLLMPQSDISLIISMYRKPPHTHTDFYLQ